MSAFIATAGTWIAGKYNERKAVKPFKNHVQRLQADSTLKSQNIVVLTKKLTLKSADDSIKSEQIGQMQGTMYQLKKENTYLAKQNAELTAWKLDAEDGVITDTVRVGIFGKIRKKKK